MILTTDGGAHPPEKWAMASAQVILPLGDVIARDRQIAASKLQLAIAEALVGHHSGAQVDEQAKLADDAEAQLHAPHDPLERAQAGLMEILALAAGTPWEAHFADPEVQLTVLQELGSHFATAEHIERQWHCHRNPSEHGAAFLAQHNLQA